MANRIAMENAIAIIEKKLISTNSIDTKRKIMHSIIISQI